MTPNADAGSPNASVHVVIGAMMNYLADRPAIRPVVASWRDDRPVQAVLMSTAISS